MFWVWGFGVEGLGFRSFRVALRAFGFWGLGLQVKGFRVEGFGGSES